MDANTVFDMAWLRSVTLKEFLAGAKSSPEAAAQVNALLNTPEGRKIGSEMSNDPDYIPVSKRVPDDDEAAQIAFDTRLAEQQAIADGLEPETPPVVEPVVEPVAEVVPPVERKKIVIEYQVTDENGSPIGRKTHIEGWDEQEIRDKYQAAHINAVRYADRMKKSKVAGAEGNVKLQQTEAQLTKSRQDAAAAAEAAKKDPALFQDAVNKAAVAARDEQIAMQAAHYQGAIISKVWMEDHKEDFLPCRANSEAMATYMAANGPSPTVPLELTYDNLELTFSKIKDKLAPVTQPADLPAPPPSNPAPVAPVVAPVATPPIAAAIVPPVEVPVVPAVVPPSQAAPAAPATTPAAAPNVQPAVRRPGVNGGLVPGSFSAERPRGTQTPQPTTKAEMLREIVRMPRGEFARRLKEDVKYVERLKAAGIPYM